MTASEGSLSISVGAPLSLPPMEPADHFVYDCGLQPIWWASLKRKTVVPGQLGYS
jgi:hypothetical protein